MTLQRDDVTEARQWLRRVVADPELDKADKAALGNAIRVLSMVENEIWGAS